MARPPVLSPALHEALAAVSFGLMRGWPVEETLGMALGLMGALSPADIGEADGEIGRALEVRQRTGLLDVLLRRRRDDRDWLERTPELAWLFLFHRDGHRREAALHGLSGGLPTPFLFTALAWRLNDWAAPVRAAALACARRCFPPTVPEVVAAAALTLLPRHGSWTRWTHEREPLLEAFARPDVAARLADLIAAGPTGPLARQLRQAARRPAFDTHLERLAREAVQPSVRAAALGILLDGEARWPAGRAYEWVDKSMGVRRLVTVFESRPLSVRPSPEALVAQGVRDRSALVRRVALDGAIRHLRATPAARRHAERLSLDRSASVRERAAYLLRAAVA